MPSPVIAALDLGSNTFRLMLAEKRTEGVGIDASGALKVAGSGGDGAVWANKKVFQHIPRLSDHLTSGGNFAPEALRRAWEALEEFDGLVKASGAVRVLAGATMAARLAADGPTFMDEISMRFGWETMILTGEEEALLTASGVLTVIEPLPENGLIFDIGGRSTEFISTVGRDVNRSRSLSIGVVGLTEEVCLGDGLVAAGELSAMAEAVKAALAGADFSDVRDDSVLVGTAGTVMTIAALLLGLKEYDPEAVNKSRLARDKVAGLLEELAALSLAQRVKQYGLHPRRADAIVPGLVMVLEFMEHFGRNELSVSDNGLLEGVWLKAAD